MNMKKIIKKVSLIQALILLQLLFVFSTNVYSQFNYMPDELIPLDSTYKTGTLANGIKYIVKSYKIPKQKALFRAYVNIGALQERNDEYGIAHLIEHLLSYSHGPRDNINLVNYFNYLKLLGLTEDDLNAHTGYECTVYDISNIPTNKISALDTALLLLKESLFNPVINENCLEREKKIVTEEWSQDRSPTRRIYIQNIVTAFQGSKYSRPEIVGDTTIINHFSIKNIFDFYTKWYKPDMLTLIAIGDFDTDEIESKIKRTFELVPPTISPTIKNTDTIPDNKKPVIVINSDNELTENSIEIHYKHNNIMRFDQKQLVEIYIDKLIDRMFHNRIENSSANQVNRPFTNISASYNMYYFYYPEYNDYLFSVSAYPNKFLEALKATLIENRRIVLYGFTDQECKDAKEWLMGLIQSYTNELPANEIYLKCYYYLLKGMVPYSSDFEKKFTKEIIPKLTVNEINNRYKQYTANIQPIITISSKDKNIPTISEVESILDSVKTIELSPYIYKTKNTQDNNLPDTVLKQGKITKQSINNEAGTTEWTFSNGIHVIMKPTLFNKDEIVFMGLKDSDKNFYKADQYSSILDGLQIPAIMGLGGISTSAMNQILSLKNVSLESIYSEKKQGMKGYSTTKNFEIALKLINLCFSNQSWKSEDTIYCGSMSTGIINFSVFRDSVNKYSGYKHYYSLGKVPTAPLNKTFQNIFYNPKDFTFLFSGSFNLKEVKPLIEKYIGSLNAIKRKDENENSFSQDSIELPTEYWWRTGRKSCEFNYPMKNLLSSILIRCQGKIIQNSENNIYSHIAQRLLIERLTKTIREKFGAAYTIGSLNNGDIVTPNFVQLSITFNTNPKNIEQIRKAALDAFENFMINGPTTDEFNFIKKKIINSRAEDLSSNKWWIDYALYNYYFNHTNTVTTYLQDAGNITQAGFVTFTKELYRQGNIIDVTMNPL